jgi:hypothetical protein
MPPESPNDQDYCAQRVYDMRTQDFTRSGDEAVKGSGTRNSLMPIYSKPETHDEGNQFIRCKEIQREVPHRKTKGGKKVKEK